MNKLDQLTSLRFFLAFWVVLHHYSVRNPSIGGGFIELGYLAVDFFFVLSGFVISYSYLSASFPTFSFLSFIRRRFARIYPLHIVFLLLYVCLYLVSEAIGVPVSHKEKYNFGEFFPSFFLLQAWGISDGLYFNFPAWSISAEWFSYVFIFPVFVFYLSRFSVSKNFFFTLFLSFICIEISFLVNVRSVLKLTHDFSILRIIPEFLIGCYFCVLYDRARLNIGAWGLMLLVILFFLILLMVGNSRFHDLLVMFLIGAFVYILASIKSSVFRFSICHPMLVLLGNASYSLYMVHMLFYTVYFNGLDIILGKNNWPVLYWYLSLVIVVAISVPLFYFFEKPSYNFLMKGER